MQTSNADAKRKRDDLDVSQEEDPISHWRDAFGSRARLFDGTSVEIVGAVLLSSHVLRIQVKCLNDSKIRLIEETEIDDVDM